MPGSYKVLRNVQPPAGAPRIYMSELDQVIAGLRQQNSYAPAVLYDVDPAFLEPTVDFRIAGKDRGSGKTIRGNRECLSLIGSDATFGGRPVINISDAGGKSSDLALYAPPPDSHTVLVVASLAPDLKAAPATGRLWSAVEPSLSQTKAYISLVASGGVAATGVASIQAADVPAANVAAVYVYVHSAVSRANRIYLNSNVIRGASTSGADLGFTAETRIGIGGVAGISESNGWRGKIARETVFTGVLNDNQITELIAAAKGYFGITG